MEYQMRLEERNGEQEYSYDYLIVADSYEEAWAVACDFASKWYGEDEDGNGLGVLVDGEDGTYEFCGGSIWVKVAALGEAYRAKFVADLISKFTIKYPKDWRKRKL
jgi:hypothetical protein